MKKLMKHLCRLTLIGIAVSGVLVLAEKLKNTEDESGIAEAE